MNPHLPSLRIGFLPFYVDYYEGICPDFPVEKQAICERLAEMLRGYGEVLWDGRMIRGESDATAAGAALAEQKPDCTVVFTSIAVFSAFPLAALAAVTGPLLIWNAQQIETVGPGYAMEEIVRNTGQIGTQALANTLVRTGRPFRVLTGYEASPRTREELGAFFAAVRTVKAVRGARLLAVGEPFPAMLDILADADVLRRELGIEVVRVGLAEWTRRNEALPADRVAGRVADLHRRHPVAGIGDDEIARSARVAEALAELVREHQVAGGTLNCHGPVCLRNPAIGVTACYSLGDQNAAGRPFTCTGDIPTAIAMLMLKHLTGVSMYTEVQVMDERRNAVVIANSGEGEPGLCRPGVPCRLRGNTNFKGTHGRGLSFAHPLAPGPATLVSFTPTPAGPKPFRLVVAEGEILDETLPDVGALAGFFRFGGASLTDAYTRWLEAGAVHHAATAPGHWARALRDVAGWLGLECVRV